jgi:hypothetical protein
MYFPYFEAAYFIESLTEEEIVDELLFLRGTKAKLSEVKVDQRTFKYLKKLGAFDYFLISEDKKWLSFTYTEQIILRISEMLWRYGFDIEMIKSVVQVLLSDNWLQDFIGNNLFAKGVSAASILENNDKTPSFLEFCIIEKKRNPNLKTFTNLDALIISTFASSKPISIIVNENGRWSVFAYKDDSELVKLNYQNSIFNDSFVNITLKSIVDELVMPNRIKSPILNPNLAGRKNLDELISKGFDYRDIQELEMDSENIELGVNKPPTTSNIAKLKNEYASQNIVIKIRSSKVVSIQQLVIKNKK